MIDWEEGLYVGARSFYKSISTKIFKDPNANSKILLQPLIGSLHIFSRLIYPENFQIFETSDPYLLKDKKICLPPSVSVFGNSDLNTKALFFNTALAAWCYQAFNAPFDLIIEDAIINKFLIAHPEFRDWWNEFQTIPVEGNPKTAEKMNGFFKGRLQRMTEGINPNSDDNTQDLEESEERAWTEEIKGKGRLDVERLEEQKDPKSEMPFHSFEKVETIDEYEGVPRMSENESDLHDKEDALEELNLRHVIRSKEKTTSLYSAEISLNSGAMQIGGKPNGGIPYPEWNYKKSRYYKNWCYVKEKEPLISSEGLEWGKSCHEKYGQLVAHSKRRLAALQANFQKKKSQPDGEEFDLESLVDAQIEILRGNSPDEKVYEDRKKTPLNAYIHFLIDTSYSTEGFFGGKQILEQLKMAAYVLGSSIEEFVDLFQISAFSSDTRKNCNFIPIKKVEERFESCLDTLGSIEPFGYTRIGPALRHASAQMSRISCQHKAVILLSDGKPNDYDTYEGMYGIKDIRKAIAEAEKEGVFTYAIAYDEKSAQYLPQMFRRGMFGRVKSSLSLIQTAAQIAFKIKYGT